ncbi:GLPGLI family protein [uncultured Algibacter sp.]|uniref:GLPGLI family protein n=1 Tax=uncultured Algibacter sp. TaxID=298659 RepID=UPI0026030BE0|nr:GLPGLI family protein [uncultured Algibacter sp.]
MKVYIKKISISWLFLFVTVSIQAQDFQGKAYYFSKTPMELGRFGAKMSEEQKKQIAARLQNRLEKTYILTFNREESMYKEDEKLDAISGATDSWGKNFMPGIQYKNIKNKTFLQEQEFYGKKFLVKDSLQSLNWKMGSETKQIGQYTCFKATCERTTFDFSWWNFSWETIRNQAEKKHDSSQTKPAINAVEIPTEEAVKMEEIIVWYTPMIPVSQGPGDYWGLPGLILEVNVGNTIILCNKVVMNPEEKTKIKTLEKGNVVTKKEYKKIITGKMKEFRENRGRRGGRRRG